MPEAHDQVTDETRAAEADDEKRTAAAGDGPTPEEDAAADRTASSGAKVADDYKESIERGANVKGEGEIV
jgi:hypothetical protein